MSRYAWLVCNDCKVTVWLGKAVTTPDNHVEYIHPAGDAQDEEKRTLNCVIWKMFADHAGHTLRVVTDQSPDYALLDDYAEIGGDEYGDIDVDTYLKGWAGKKVCE